MLKTAFNMIIALHSRSATLKRLGTPTLYSPIKIMPSNYFRFLEGASATVIRGREFVIPIDAILGHSTQTVIFSTEPTDGTFTLSYGMLSTTDLDFDATEGEIQTALRLVTGLENVLVEGIEDGLSITFVGIETPSTLTAVSTLTDVDDEDVTIAVTTGLHTLWDLVIKRGDKIIDPVLGHMAIDEVIEMVDLGGSVMGFRVRAE